MDANVFQRTVDYPDEFALGFHVLIDDDGYGEAGSSDHMVVNGIYFRCSSANLLTHLTISSTSEGSNSL